MPLSTTVWRFRHARTVALIRAAPCPTVFTQRSLTLSWATSYITLSWKIPEWNRQGFPYLLWVGERTKLINSLDLIRILLGSNVFTDAICLDFKSTKLRFCFSSINLHHQVQWKLNIYRLLCLWVPGASFRALWWSLCHGLGCNPEPRCWPSMLTVPGSVSSIPVTSNEDDLESSGHLGIQNRLSVELVILNFSLYWEYQESTL